MTTDAKILSALRANPDGVSGADWPSNWHQPRGHLGAHRGIAPLGYDIEAGPHFGYRLVSVPDALHADDLLARLGKTKVIGRDIRVFEQTTSTNDVIEKLARDGVKEGVVVFAESQTKGRGRLGRKWISPAYKGLWFSVLLRPGFAPAGNHAVDGRLRHGPAPRHCQPKPACIPKSNGRTTFWWAEKKSRAF
jgi:BirA family transcriptional regulator, biotin operon repressor / biotin---[acetyl-CoA-carboxylase] ligase